MLSHRETPSNPVLLFLFIYYFTTPGPYGEKAKITNEIQCTKNTAIRDLCVCGHPLIWWLQPLSPRLSHTGVLSLSSSTFPFAHRKKIQGR